MIFFQHKYNEIDDLIYLILQQSLIYIHLQKQIKYGAMDVQDDFSEYIEIDYVSKKNENENESVIFLTHQNNEIVNLSNNLHKEIDDELHH